MHKIITSAILSLFVSLNILAQSSIDVSNIEIIRDEFGVPHIFTTTDAEATYGIAWAQCEDNFHLMQDNFAFTQNSAGRLMGKDGAVLDFLYQVFQIEDFVNERYDQDISPEMEQLLISYTDAINKYAETFPKEVKYKKIFPVKPKDVLGNLTLHMMLLHTSSMELGKFLTKGFDYALVNKSEHGSNAMAYSPNITEDGNTYLVGNPHQPVNSMGNWWEVSVHSEEGYEFFGSTFSIGGLFPAIGANRNLGWTHTTNYQNSADIYLLEMHPTEKNQYKYDGEWLTLEEKHAKLKVKIGPLIIPVKKKYYLSKYGPTFEKESGFYSYKSHVFYNVKGAEQWYKMGKATNYAEFMEALKLQGLANQTITYADKSGSIYHVSNFSHPYRNENEDWSEVNIGNTSVLDGTSSSNNWTTEKIHPVEDLPNVLNPKCGYVFNCNNTPLEITAANENPRLEDFPASFGILTSTTVRAKTFMKLINLQDKVSFADVRKIREDVSVDKNNMSFRNCMNCDDLPEIFAKYPELSEIKKVFDNWNGEFTVDNKQAIVFALSSMYFEKYIISEFGNEEKDIPEDVIVESFLKTEKFLLKHYKTLEVPLGEVQKAVRFDVEMPMYGGPNTLANSHVKIYNKNKLEITGGDSYIFYANFGEDGLVSYESINAFGNSLKKDHPHSTDQTEKYVNLQTKPAILDLEKLRQQGTAYHPK